MYLGWFCYGCKKLAEKDINDIINKFEANYPIVDTYKQYILNWSLINYILLFYRLLIPNMIIGCKLLL